VGHDGCEIGLSPSKDGWVLTSTQETLRSVVSTRNILHYVSNLIAYAKHSFDSVCLEIKAMEEGIFGTRYGR
jgi:hypothetical protein